MLLLIILLPLIGSISAGLYANFIGSKNASILTTLIMFINIVFCFLLAQIVLVDENIILIKLGTWMNSGMFFVEWAFQCDKLTMSMLFVVNCISLLVHLYSTEYMGQDPHLSRFMSYLSLFTFFMLILVTGDNFIIMFLGWEGVGLCSYLLISFWYTRIQANKAAIKALVVNRISDFGFTLGIITVFVAFQTVDFATVFGLAPAFINKSTIFLGFEINILTLICVLLFIGAMGKSAQIGLHTWLPDAMEGPTPVSALIHAATMVTAGVFLVIKCSPLFEYVPNVLTFITLIGAITAFFSATTGLVQSDIKKVIAYSTCSQLGYMFFICGLSGYHFSLLHLINHAFFKALLFLSAGAIIHSMSNEQDMRRFGGLITLLPFTYVMLFIGSLSLMGFPFLTGYYSKDLILEFAFIRYSTTGTMAYWLGITTAMFTSFYSFRVLYLTFLSSPNSFKSVMTKVHEVPFRMAIALISLCFGSIFLGFFLKDVFLTKTGINYIYWEKSIFVLTPTNFFIEAEFIPGLIKILPLIFSFIGVFSIFAVNSPSIIVKMKPHLLESSQFVTLTQIFSFLSNKWYFDVIYNKLISYPILHIANRITFESLDKGILELLGPHGLWEILYWVSNQFKRFHTGIIYQYALFILFIFSFIVINPISSSIPMLGILGTLQCAGEDWESFDQWVNDLNYPDRQEAWAHILHVNSTKDFTQVNKLHHELYDAFAGGYEVKLVFHKPSEKIVDVFGDYIADEKQKSADRYWREHLWPIKRPEATKNQPKAVEEIPVEEIISTPKPSIFSECTMFFHMQEFPLALLLMVLIIIGIVIFIKRRYPKKLSSNEKQ